VENTETEETQEITLLQHTSQLKLSDLNWSEAVKSERHLWRKS